MKVAERALVVRWFAANALPQSPAPSSHSPAPSDQPRPLTYDRPLLLAYPQRPQNHHFLEETVTPYEKGKAISAQPVVDDEAKKFLFGQGAATVRQRS